MFAASPHWRALSLARAQRPRATSRLFAGPATGYASSMTIRSFGVAAVFLAGCAVGGASARFVVPAASAQQAATLTKWEYFCFKQDTSFADPKDIGPRSNRAGLEGWEMVNAIEGLWCFKRPKM